MAYERLTPEELRERSFQRSVGWYEGKRVHPLTQGLIGNLFGVMIVWTLAFGVMNHFQSNRIKNIETVFAKHKIDRKEMRTQERREAWEQKFIGYRLNGYCTLYPPESAKKK